MKNAKQNLIGIYTRSPLHVGAGTSVDIVDLPVMRERITNFPVIPATSLKGVLRQQARDIFGGNDGDPAVNLLFGKQDDEQTKDANGKKQSYAGAVIVGEGKLLAFPVRSLKGCFAWITCPTALRRFERDWGISLDLDKLPLKPDHLKPDHCYAGTSVAVSGSNDDCTVVLEEYPLTRTANKHAAQIARKLLKTKICDDPVWLSDLADRLVIVHDDNFQHLVTSCTEIVARIEMNPATRTNENLFNQENVPCEALFYSVCTLLDARRPGDSQNPKQSFRDLFGKDRKTLIQIGGDETVGLGLCEVKLTEKGEE